MDCHEEDREEHTYTGEQGAPGPTLDSGCLLDPLWGASGGPELPRQIMLFWSLVLERVVAKMFEVECSLSIIC